jgi:pimeloyl-ACP methyl ester carboxylesterase
MAAYAEIAVLLLQHLRVRDVVVLGWSLGGHVGIEMMESLGRKAAATNCNQNSLPAIVIRGLMIVGTPPANGLDQVRRAFRLGNISLDPEDGEVVAGKEILTEEDVGFCAKGFTGLAEPPDWVVDDIRRCDGRARKMMWQSFIRGEGVDQVAVVGRNDVCVAVVNGAEEQFVDLEYLDGLEWGDLWMGKCVRMEGCGHAPFL